MIELLLFLIVMAITIIGDGKYWKFDPNGGAIRKVRRKKLEESWKEIEKGEKERKRRKERLATLFPQIETQVSQELAEGRSTNRIVSLPNCRGSENSTFLKVIEHIFL